MTQGAYEGLLFCAQILIPSLFFFSARNEKLFPPARECRRNNPA